MVSSDLGVKLENVTIQMLGRTKKVMIGKENTCVYQRRTRAAEALIASAYLAGVNTRRVRRALLFAATIGGR